METKDVTKSLGSMGELFDVVTERGVLSALYLTALALPLIASATTFEFVSLNYLWIAGTCAIFGLIISKVTSEVLLNSIRRITEPIVLFAFHNVVGSKVMPSYADFRKFRETYLASEIPSGQNYLKARILKDESLLHTTTYLMCSSLFALPILVVLLILPNLVNVSQLLIILELCVVGYILIASYFAERSRSAALGRSVGHAYLNSLAGEKK